MVLRILEFPMAWEFRGPREIPITQEFPRLKLFPPISWEMGISREFLTRGFPLNIPGIAFSTQTLHLVSGVSAVFICWWFLGGVDCFSILISSCAACDRL